MTSIFMKKDYDLKFLEIEDDLKTNKLEWAELNQAEAIRLQKNTKLCFQQYFKFVLLILYIWGRTDQCLLRYNASIGVLMVAEIF
jgi:hypothetical protein